jgi:hypothetical protein
VVGQQTVQIGQGVQGVQGVHVQADLLSTDLLSRITGGRLYVDDVPIEQVEAAIK